VREHQITQMTKSRANIGLDLVMLSINETKKGKTSFLLDTGATLTLVKIGNLKGDTKMRDERIALTGVTGHKIYTLGKIRATKNMSHNIYGKRFSYRLRRIDFLTKQQAKCDRKRNYESTT